MLSVHIVMCNCGFSVHVLVESVEEGLALPDDPCRARLLGLCPGQREPVVHVALHQQHSLEPVKYMYIHS